MGFAFAKRKDDTLTLVQPISPCKDYLNDVIYAEHTGNNISAYGLNCKKEDIFTYGEGYMIISVCLQGASGGYEYGNYKRDYKLLADNYQLLEHFMRNIEEMLGLEQRTTIEQLEENKYLVTVPIYWCEGTYLISLYSLFLRVGLFWDGQKDIIKYLDEFDKEFPADSYLLKSVMPKFEKLVKGDKPKQDLNSMVAGTGVHNCGIVGFHW